MFTWIVYFYLKTAMLKLPYNSTTKIDFHLKSALPPQNHNTTAKLQ